MFLLLKRNASILWLTMVEELDILFANLKFFETEKKE